MSGEDTGTCGGQGSGSPKGGSSFPSKADIDWSKVDDDNKTEKSTGEGNQK